MTLSIDQLFSLPGVSQTGLSSLTELTPATKRELARRVKAGSVISMPDAVWPRHRRYFQVAG